ncbi:MAG: hypothetical protein MZW92_01200 [Comamonadaceae bacterium]|nr:hypothetical protein [Comamonadaceae bacterium]
MALREILKHPGVESVTLVDLDPEMTRLFSTRAHAARAERAIRCTRPSCSIVNADAVAMAGSEPRGTSTSSWSTFPTRPTSRWASSTPTGFYRAAGAAPRRRAARIVVQATSPLYARRSPSGPSSPRWRRSGFQAAPYHALVPSFGEWGFILAGREPYRPPAALPTWNCAS